MFELWLKQATNLSLWQSILLIVLCLFFAACAMSIDYIDEEEK